MIQETLMGFLTHMHFKDTWINIGTHFESNEWYAYRDNS